MKRNQIVTLAVVGLFIGALFFINRHEPARVSEQRKQEAAEAKKQVERTETNKSPKNFKEMMRSKAANAMTAAITSAASVSTVYAASDAAPYQVEFTCSNGTFVVEVYPDWAPLGAEQFKKIIESGAFNDARFFRALPGFIVQWGIPGDPEQAEIWDKRVIRDDPVKQSNKRGTITYATAGPNTRSSQVFINLNDRNTFLDSKGFSPFGKVIKGMEVVDSIYNGYQEESGQQGEIKAKGNAFLKEHFPKLDYIKTAKIIAAAPADKPAAPAAPTAPSGDKKPN